MTREMLEAADDLEFERAAYIRDKIKALKKGAPTDVSDAADSATAPRAKKKSSRKQAAARSRNARKQKK